MSSRPSNVFQQIGAGAPSISANLMSTGNNLPNSPRSNPRTTTPLKYNTPQNNQPHDNNPFDPDEPQDPEGNQNSNHGDPPEPSGNPNPDDPDGDDGPPDDPPDNCPEGDRFIGVLLELTGSLHDLCRDAPPKTKKIKVRDPNTFDSSDP